MVTSTNRSCFGTAKSCLYSYDLFNRLSFVSRKAEGKTKLMKIYKYNYATQ